MISDDEKWAEKRCKKEVRLALKAVGEAARQCGSLTQMTQIPLKVTPGAAKEALLAKMVISKLKALEFVVSYRDSNTDGKAREYYLIWGKNYKIPDGFNLI